LAPATNSTGIQVGGQDPGLRAGGADGVGSLPKTAGQTTSPPSKTATVGQVIDAVTRQPVSHALVVVTDPLGQIAGLAFTDADGLFVIYLFAVPGLELAIPGEGVAGVPIEAGDVITILVP
jgi:hypothetical protein